MVTTQENSFLIWGSRPLIKSPLHTLLSREDHTHPMKDDDSSVKTLSSPDANKDSFKTTGSDLLHRRCISSVTVDHRSHDSTEGICKTSNTAGVQRSSSLDLSSVPHVMVACSAASTYMDTLTQTLRDMERGGGRRGTFVSSEAGVGSVDREGVILEPKSLDLGGHSGFLFDLSTQGLQQPKLEGVAYFAGNVLILIEAKVTEGERRMSLAGPPKQQLFVMSKKLRERRHLNRSFEQCLL